MRAFKRYTYRGFTLVELMIVVAIIGVLAALAIYGVRRYLASAKTAEAKMSIGAMARGQVSAYERENGGSANIAPGASGTLFNHDMCAGAGNIVPSTQTSIKGKKYTPSMATGCDFETGDFNSGWKCVKFNLSSPSYFQYALEGTNLAGTAGGALFTANGGALVTTGAAHFMAQAAGDLDGDTTMSAFGLGGQIYTATQQLALNPEIMAIDEFE